MAVSLANQSHRFFMTPGEQAKRLMDGFEPRQRTGKENALNFLCISGLFLVQTVASVAAVPLQLISGVFGCLNQLLKGEGKRAFAELQIGLVTSGKHALAIVGSATLFAVFMTFLTLTFPCMLCSWNQPLSAERAF